MALLTICKYGQEILRTKTKRINFNLMAKQLPKIINDMTQTCLAFNGVGIAATQVGLDISLAVVLLPLEEEDSYKRYVLINPEISNRQGSVLSSEGCLSFPGLSVQVPRAKKVKVKYLNEKGLPVELNAEGFLAIILQHEIDHLEGRVFIDRVPEKDLPKVQEELKKLAREW